MKRINDIGTNLYSLAKRLFPICRSITGDGVRETLKIIKEHISLEIHEVPSGTPVFDWTVPKEWNITDAWVKDPSGKKIIDFKENNLHILNYSLPIHKKMSLQDLQQHLFTLPNHPEWIPYRTSYYEENWGFCLSHKRYESLKEGTYEVMIDASLEYGALTYGEYFIAGESKEEILFSTHICHPSLANDNLSGISILTFLAKQLSKTKNRFSYRFLFIPGTIGAITWLALNESKTKKIKYGIVASLLGDPAGFTYKKSRRGNTHIDRIVPMVLKQSGLPFQIKEFFPYGYDERQFCSPGFNLAVGNLSRSPFGEFPEYHTSADNLDFIQPQALEESLSIFLQIIEVLENDKTYINLCPKCEPQLGKRGLYDAIGGNNDEKSMQMAMLWLLNLSDGFNSLLDIAERSGLPFHLLQNVTAILCKHELLKPLE